MIKVFFKDHTVISLIFVISFCLWFVSSLFSPAFVSAETSYTFVFPEEPLISGLPSGLTAENVAAEIYDNDSLAGLGYTSNNSYFFVNYNSYDNSFSVYVVFEDDIVFDVIGKSYLGGQYHQFPLAIFLKGVKSVATGIANLNTCTYTSFTSVPTGNNTSFGICRPDYVQSSYKQYMVCSFYYDSNYGFYNSFELDYNRGYCFGTYILPPFNPDKGYYQYYYNGVQFSFDPDDFYTWIINNNKLVELPSYIVESKLLSFLNFYKDYGGSATSFFQYIPQWFTYMSIGGQTNDNINILKNSIDKLFREYQTYLSNNHAYWPGAVKLEKRNNIDTKTDNDNLDLVTDKQSDDDVTLILRDILRGVIAIPNQLFSVGQSIIGALNQLDFTVNVANNGGVGFDTNSIWGTGDITQSENYLALTSAFMDKGVDVSVAENMKINYLDNATQQDSFTVSVVMPDQYLNGQFTEKTVTHTIDSTSKMFNTLLLFRKLIAFAVIAYFAIRIRFELPHLIRGE